MKTSLMQLWQRKPWRFLSGTGLKWVAVVTMLVDHVGAIVLWSQYTALRGTAAAADCHQLYLLTREIGRVAFPLFCFVLVEGFTHTHSKPKYALRLLLFAIASEPFYDFALHDGVSYLSQLNIMFTMLLAFCALWAGEALGQLVGQGVGRLLPDGAGATQAQDGAPTSPHRTPQDLATSLAEFVFTVAALAGAAFLAGDDYLDVSYHAYGVVLIGVLYLARGCRPLQFALGCLATWWYCVEHASWLQMWAVLGLALIVTYNGRRGRGMKYFFYLFYPLHLLAIKLIQIWLL